MSKFFFRCTILHGTPTMYVDLVAKQSERKENISLDIAVIGGAILTPNLVNQVKNILNVRKINVSCSTFLSYEIISLFSLVNLWFV